MKDYKALLYIVWVLIGFDLFIFYLLYLESLKEIPVVFWELVGLSILTTVILILALQFRKELKKELNKYKFYDK